MYNEQEQQENLPKKFAKAEGVISYILKFDKFTLLSRRTKKTESSTNFYKTLQRKAKD